MTTPRNYYKADRAAVTAKILAQMPTSYMTANLSTAWKGWRDISGTLDLGAAGGINAQSCGAIHHLQATRPPSKVVDRDAPISRHYTLIVYFRRQADPTSLAIVDTFDELFKDRLYQAFDTDSTKDIRFAPHWTEQERGDTYIDTAHVAEIEMAN